MNSTTINNFKLLILCLPFFFYAKVYGGNDALVGGIKTVVIDPGHGGKDPGCHGESTHEKEVTLAIGLKLGSYIKEKYPEINVIFTRETDIFIELDERAQIANRNNADLFICIHANAGPSNAYGVETYVLGLHRTEAQRKIAERENASIQFEENSEEKYEKLSADAIIARQLQLSVFLDHSIMFASKLQEQFVAIGRHDRGVRQAGFLVLYKTTMPSVLIETGFLTNKQEEEFLANPESQEKMAKSMFKAFEEYKEYYEAGSSLGPVMINGIDPEKFGMAEDEVAAGQLIYRVQIETSTEELSYNDPRFKGMPVWMYQSNGLYKYTVGVFSDVDKAKELKEEMRTKGYEHAFIVKFRDGERIN